jgi:hypothetical protein
MRRPATHRWLKLLLALLIAIGPLSLYAGDTAQAGCCSLPGTMTSSGNPGCDHPAETANCDQSPEHSGCGPQHGCPCGHVPATGLITPSTAVPNGSVQDGFSPVTHHLHPIGVSAPPTPPPIV